MLNAHPCAESKTTRLDRIHWKYASYKSAVKLFLYGIWWGFLWKVGLGKPYGKLMCRMKWYRKFPDGRCMYCGVIK